MPTKDLAPFSYISPQKTLFSTIKYELTTEFSKWVKSQKTEKNAPPTNPATAPRRKFLSLLRYQLLIDVNEMRVKIITLTVSVRVSVTVRVSLVLFVCITVSVRDSTMVWVSLV